jgi:hypothetical protein
MDKSFVEGFILGLSGATFIFTLGAFSLMALSNMLRRKDDDKPES